jgi:hypothetical protein
MRKRFDFVSDPSHGWLKVPLTELERLGIVDQISAYSFLKDGMAYLEEDRDMKVFTTARDAAGEGDIRMIEHVRNRESRIRKYPSFTDAIAVTADDKLAAIAARKDVQPVTQEDAATITEIGTLEADAPESADA